MESIPRVAEVFRMVAPSPRDRREVTGRQESMAHSAGIWESILQGHRPGIYTCPGFMVRSCHQRSYVEKRSSHDRNALGALRRFVLFPGSAGLDSRMSIGWYDPKDGCAPEDQEARRSTAPRGGSAKYDPYLRIETLYVLEAIAATIYVDKVNRLRYGKCKQCDRLFKIDNDHGREFCPPPAWLNTSPCKNTFLQHERRATIDTLKDLFLEGWAKGLSESEIRRSWIAKRIEPTRKLISEAKGKARKQSKRQSRRSSR